LSTAIIFVKKYLFNPLFRTFSIWGIVIGLW
jgi:hypothetical protein